MTQKPLPSADVLREILAYDPETGSLMWLERGAHHFSSTPTHTAEALAAQFNARYAGKPALTAVDSVGYRSGRLFNSQVRAHRVIWKMVSDEEPALIDHINRDKTDNRISNLRAACKSVNGLNRDVGRTNISGVVGVCWVESKQRWVAHIKRHGRRLSRRFLRKDDAVEQRRRWERVALGDQPSARDLEEQAGDEASRDN